MTEHTPTPWRIENRYKATDPSLVREMHILITHDGVQYIANLRGNKADAEFIVRAVNNFEGVLSLLRRNLERMKLINGPDEKCAVDVELCANHSLIHETEKAIREAEKS